MVDHKIIRTLCDGLEEAMTETAREAEPYIYAPTYEAFFEHPTNDGTITVRVTPEDKVTCEVYHDERNEELDCPIIAEAVQESLQTWEEIERELDRNEWTDHGFSSERDYNEWRYGRGMFM